MDCGYQGQKVVVGRQRVALVDQGLLEEVVLERVLLAQASEAQVHLESEVLVLQALQGSWRAPAEV